MVFSADAMIQAVKNKLHLSDEDFIKILSEDVYAPIKNKVSNEEWKSFVKVHETTNVSGIAKKDWIKFENVKNSILEHTSANLLSKVVMDAILQGMGPKAILTFNGEAIFLALLNYYYWLSDTGNTNMFDRIVNGISRKNVNRIPYIHCHGIIPINGVKKKNWILCN